MNAMTILNRCRAARNEIARLKQRIEQRYEILDGLSAPQADPIGGSHGSTDPDKIGRILADIDQLKREMKAREEAQMAEKASAVALLDMVPELESKVLYAYYVQGKDTTAIARKEKYQASYLRKVKRNAEQLLEMLSPDRVTGTLPAWYLRERWEK